MKIISLISIKQQLFSQTSQANKKKEENLGLQVCGHSTWPAASLHKTKLFHVTRFTDAAVMPSALSHFCHTHDDNANVPLMGMSAEGL